MKYKRHTPTNLQTVDAIGSIVDGGLIAAPSDAAWKPTDITTLKGWYTESDMVFSDGKLTSWPEKTNNMADLVKIKLSGDITLTDIRGRQAAEFNGAYLDWESHPSWSTYFTDPANDLALVAVFEVASWINSLPMVAGDCNSYFGLHTQYTPNRIIGFRSDGGSKTVSIEVATDQLLIFALNLTSTQMAMENYMGGLPVTRATGSTADVSGCLRVGCNYSTQYVHARIGEILLFDEALASADRTNLINYLKGKWQ